jgi:hypothetical protein
MLTRVSKPASLCWLVHGQWLPSLYEAADAFFSNDTYMLPYKIRARTTAPKN